MNTTTIRQAVSKFSTGGLQHARRTIETEQLFACAHAAIDGYKPTQANVGQLEMLEAIGAELDARGALLPAPPFVDVCHEDGVRFAVTVRVW